VSSSNPNDNVEAAFAAARDMLDTWAWMFRSDLVTADAVRPSNALENDR